MTVLNVTDLGYSPHHRQSIRQCSNLYKGRDCSVWFTVAAHPPSTVTDNWKIGVYGFWVLLHMNDGSIPRNPIGHQFMNSLLVYSESLKNLRVGFR